ncbi:unnamed protein product [Closterium sp. NIES-54]
MAEGVLVGGEMGESVFRGEWRGGMETLGRVLIKRESESERNESVDADLRWDLIGDRRSMVAMSVTQLPCKKMYLNATAPNGGIGYGGSGQSNEKADQHNDNVVEEGETNGRCTMLSSNFKILTWLGNSLEKE